MYILQSTKFSENDWKTESLPLMMRVADKLIKERILRSAGRRRYRLVRQELAHARRD
jgi:hypothetical protein